MSVLLTLYDGGEWDHGTANVKSAKFSMKRTNLCLGGLTQTGHVLNLFDNKEQMTSGLIPRFLTLMLQPVHTSIRKMKKGSANFQKKLKTVIKEINLEHNGDHKQVLLRESKAFDIFAEYHDQVSEWIQNHQYKLNHQNAITMVSKSIGQIFRLSGILNQLYISWNLDEVKEFEGNDLDFRGEGFVPISALSMQSALSIVNLFSEPKFDYSK